MYSIIAYLIIQLKVLLQCIYFISLSLPEKIVKTRVSCCKAASVNINFYIKKIRIDCLVFNTFLYINQGQIFKAAENESTQIFYDPFQDESVCLAA